MTDAVAGPPLTLLPCGLWRVFQLVDERIGRFGTQLELKLNFGWHVYPVMSHQEMNCIVVVRSIQNSLSASIPMHQVEIILHNVNTMWLHAPKTFGFLNNLAHLHHITKKRKAWRMIWRFRFRCRVMITPSAESTATTEVAKNFLTRYLFWRVFLT